MKALKALLEGLELSDVTTYVQSGNVVFKADTAVAAAGLEAAIEKEFGFAVTVVVRTKREMGAVVKRNPFLKEGADPSKLHVTFLVDKPAQHGLKDVEADKFAPDELRLLGREVYLHTPNGYGRSKLSNDFFEKRTGVRATTRNWNTVTKLVALAE